ncbi:hypothetical protein ABK040_007743 [Willaertia magna]
MVLNTAASPEIGGPSYKKQFKKPQSTKTLTDDKESNKESNLKRKNSSNVTNSKEHKKKKVEENNNSTLDFSDIYDNPPASKSPSSNAPVVNIDDNDNNNALVTTVKTGEEQKTEKPTLQNDSKMKETTTLTNDKTQASKKSKKTNSSKSNTKIDVSTKKQDTDVLNTMLKPFEKQLLQRMKSFANRHKEKYEKVIELYHNLLENLDNHLLFDCTDPLEKVMDEIVDDYLPSKVQFKDVKTKNKASSSKNSAKPTTNKEKANNQSILINLKQAKRLATKESQEELLSLFLNENGNVLKSFTKKNIANIENTIDKYQKLQTVLLYRYASIKQIDEMTMTEEMEKADGNKYEFEEIRNKMRWGKKLYKYPVFFWCRYNMHDTLEKDVKAKLKTWQKENSDFVKHLQSLIDKMCKSVKIHEETKKDNNEETEATTKKAVTKQSTKKGASSSNKKKATSGTKRTKANNNTSDEKKENTDKEKSTTCSKKRVKENTDKEQKKTKAKKV